jgi:hypothetical protein
MTTAAAVLDGLLRALAWRAIGLLVVGVGLAVRSVAIGFCTYLVLQIALHRLLGVSLWEGALQM